MYISLEAKNKRENFASSFTAPEFFFYKLYFVLCYEVFAKQKKEKKVERSMYHY